MTEPLTDPTALIPHVDEWGDGECSCGMKEVTPAQQQLLALFDDWYGDKSYRKHREIRGWADKLTKSLLTQLATVNAKLSHLADLHRAEQNARYEVVGLLNTMWNGTVNAPTRERILRVLAGVTPAVPEPLTPASPCSDCGLPLAAHTFAVCAGKPAAVLPALPKDDRGATQAERCPSRLADLDGITLYPCVADAGHNGEHWSRHRLHEWEDAEQYDPNAPDAAPVVAEEFECQRTGTCCSGCIADTGECCKHPAAPAVVPAATDGQVA